MKKIIKSIYLVLSIISLNLSGCSMNEYDLSKEFDTQNIKETDRIEEIDWSKLIGYAFYGKEDKLYLIIEMPNSIKNLYYSSDEEYKWYEKIGLVLNGKDVRDIEVKRENERVIFKAYYNSDGTISEENYDIRGPDNKIYNLYWEYKDDIEFMSEVIKEIDH